MKMKITPKLEPAQVTSVSLPEGLDHYTTPDWPEDRRIGPLGRINIFVGANNSGKSRLMRALAGSPGGLLGQARGTSSEYQAQALNEVHTQIANLFGRGGYRLVSGIDSNLLRPRNLSKNDMQDNPHLIRPLEELARAKATDQGNERLREEDLREFRRLARRGLEAVYGCPELALDRFPHVYIPVLRGLRGLGEQDAYLNRTQADYWKSSGPAGLQIFTGLGLFEEVRQRLLGPNSARTQIQEYQSRISRAFWNGEEVALIPRHDDDVLHVKIGRERERPIYDLGDGLQTCIALTFLPCVTTEPTWFFLEEPEIHLHPGLQRKLLQILLEQEQHLYFLTTHSNHLLDMTLDFSAVAFFNLRKALSTDGSSNELDPSFEIWQASRADQDSLSLLGVRNSSVFLVNATLWVEGITDRLYLRRMLTLFQESEEGASLPSIDEDVHFAFVEYGGSNVAHWSFLEEPDSEEETAAARRLCGQALLLVDDDGGKHSERKARFARELGERFKVLPGREIENLLPLQAICGAVEEYEPESVDPGDYSWEDYKDAKIGIWIESQLLAGEWTRKGGYKTTRGSIKSKPDFCRKAIEHLRWEDLSPQVQELIREIYQFVAEKNVLLGETRRAAPLPADEA